MLGRKNLLHRQSGGMGTGRHGRDELNCKTKEAIFVSSSEAYGRWEFIWESQLSDVFPNAEVSMNGTVRCGWHTPQKRILPVKG